MSKLTGLATAIVMLLIVVAVAAPMIAQALHSLTLLVVVAAGAVVLVRVAWVLTRRW